MKIIIIPLLLILAIPLAFSVDTSTYQEEEYCYFDFGTPVYYPASCCEDCSYYTCDFQCCNLNCDDNCKNELEGSCCIHDVHRIREHFEFGHYTDHVYNLNYECTSSSYGRGSACHTYDNDRDGSITNVWACSSDYLPCVDDSDAMHKTCKCCASDSGCRYPLDPDIEESKKTCVEKETGVSYTDERYNGCNDGYDNDGDGKVDCMDQDCEKQRCEIELEGFGNHVNFGYCSVCIRTSWPEGYGFICCGNKDEQGYVTGETRTFTKEEGCSIDYPEEIDYDYCYSGNCVSNSDPYQVPKVCCAYFKNYEDEPKTDYEFVLPDFCPQWDPFVYSVNESYCGMVYGNFPQMYMIPQALVMNTENYYQGFSSIKLDLIDEHNPPPEEKRIETPKGSIECKYSVWSETITKILENGSVQKEEVFKTSKYDEKKIMGEGSCQGFNINKQYDLYSEMPVFLDGGLNARDDGRIIERVCFRQDKIGKLTEDNNIVICPSSASFSGTVTNSIDIETIIGKEALDTFEDYPEWEEYGPNALSKVTFTTGSIRYAHGEGIPPSLNIKMEMSGDAHQVNLGVFPFSIFDLKEWSSLGLIRSKTLSSSGISSLIDLLKDSEGNPVLLTSEEVDSLVYKGVVGGPSRNLKYHAKGYNYIDITLRDDLYGTVTEEVWVRELRWIPFKGPTWSYKKVYSKKSEVDLVKGFSESLSSNQLVGIYLGALLFGKQLASKMIISEIALSIGDSLSSLGREYEDSGWIRFDGEIPAEYKNYEGEVVRETTESIGEYRYVRNQEVEKGLWPKFRILSESCIFSEPPLQDIDIDEIREELGVTGNVVQEPSDPFHDSFLDYVDFSGPSEIDFDFNLGLEGGPIGVGKVSYPGQYVGLWSFDVISLEESVEKISNHFDTYN